MRPEYPTDGDSTANIEEALDDTGDGGRQLSDDEVQELLDDLEE